MKIVLVILLFILLAKCWSKHPVLLVPGDGGSHLTVQYLQTPPHYLCGRQHRWILLWLNLYYLITPITLDCFVKSAKLEYDKLTQRTFAPHFCDINVPGFGSVDAVDYISNIRIKKTSYYHYIINELVKNHGYDPYKDIRGAPYDFRKSPNEMMEFMRDMKSLIEEMYEVNQKSVVLVGHSLGALYLTLMLHPMAQEWKDKYIKAFISISGPYAGAVDAIRAVLSGRNEHIVTVHPAKVQPALSSWPSTYFLMPSSHFMTTKPIVSIKSKSFNPSTILDLLKLSKIPNAVDHYKNNVDIKKNLTAPKTAVYCIYSNNVPTSEYLEYRDMSFPSAQPEISNGLGDGSVNLVSLQRCTDWKEIQDQPVLTKIIPSVSHLQILRDSRFLKYFSDTIGNINKDV